MAKAPTVITAAIAINGRIEGAEDVEVFGRIQGAVQLEGNLYIDEQARVDAEVEVTNLTIHGIYVGNATASESIELAPSARVVGDLTAPRVIVQAGARYRGMIDMGDVDSETPAAETGKRSGRGSRGRTGASRSSAGRSSTRRAARAEPARAAEPAPTKKPRRAKKPAPAPEPPEVVEEDDLEPELPAAAATKKVSVKKRS